MWSSLTAGEKAVFHPPHFHQLATSTYLADLPSPNDLCIIPSDLPSLKPPLTTENLETMVPTYRQLVNTCKVATEISKGKFGTRAGPWTDERWGQNEIGKIAGRLSSHPSNITQTLNSNCASDLTST